MILVKTLRNSSQIFPLIQTIVTSSLSFENEKNRHTERTFFHLVDLRLILNLANDSRFSYHAPIIYSVDPIEGPLEGGQLIKIKGANFGLKTFEIKEVLVRGVVCKDIHLIDPGLITCVTGASSIMGPGSGNVIIKNLSGLSSPENTCNNYEYRIIEKVIVPDLKPAEPECLVPVTPAIVVKNFNAIPNKLFSFKEKDYSNPSREDILNSLNRHLREDYNLDNKDSLVQKIQPINYLVDKPFSINTDGFRKKRFAKIIDQLK